MTAREPAASSGVDFAPHRRAAGRGRFRHALRRTQEKAVVAGYRAASWAFGHVPTAITVPLMELIFVAGSAAWSAKRRIVESNASHVLGLPPGHPKVRRHVRRVYRLYARYIVDLMRLPWLSTEDIARSFTADHTHVVDAFGALFDRLRAEGRGMIVVSAHIGCIEEFIASVADRGWPVYGVADDTAYPELYALLERQRERWGVREIAWRNLRETFRVLRERSILALLVDWGYRAEDVPVRLFGDWTTLPAGPALLAGRTRAAIVPVVNRRRDDGTLEAQFLEPIEVRDTTPEEIARATQAVASALEQLVRPAPAQWHAFKPIWPATEAEAGALAERAVAGTAAAAGP
jgi:KDO2-lipid IV(A) lauroyltransferase